ncbi:tautomerase family protein [Phreatobacter stygius]|uniref:Tautomerase family protein n=1 Tax=Phreatobacter stygius TaxID=1940610 RepID=A0A4D7AWQ4_9HYPH|nr:tautomerase family protein [Phreatobacter stygius]QCI63935.1 tautomerase family protein [Phreatobacter stygius]
MPFARISLLKGKPPAYLGALSDGLHQALVEAFDVPRDDRFQVIHQLEPGELIFDRHYLGGPRSDDFVLIQITAGRPRSTEVKRAFYRRLVAVLAEAPGLRPEDVMVVITTGGADEWSFGSGEAQMVASTEAPAEAGHAQQH